MYRSIQESRDVAEKSHDACGKIRYVSKFTAESCGSPYDSTALVYRVISRRAQLCHSISRRSGIWSHRLEYFENKFTADYLKVNARADPNMGDLVQRKHTQN